MEIVLLILLVAGIYIIMNKNKKCSYKSNINTKIISIRKEQNKIQKKYGKHSSEYIVLSKRLDKLRLYKNEYEGGEYYVERKSA